MARSWLVLATALAVAAPLGAQDEKAIKDKVEKALAEEMKRLREDLAQIVQGELTGKPPAPKGELDKALALVTVDLLKKHAMYLAGDELEGRGAGFPGNDKATEYIAGIMKAAGLKPVGEPDEGGAATYWQNFRVGGKKTRNCLGFLEGSDPELKKEIVVVGGHHDHLGKDGQEIWGRMDGPREKDKIWNGADDNGSGTTVVLGMIEAFGKGGLRAKRSILFMTFSGEEWGLVGSRHYTNKPIAPIEQHVFMLNMDMVGRNPDKPVEIHGVGSAEDNVVRKAVEDAVAKAYLKAVLHDRVQLLGGDSDHSSFRDKGVPFAFFFTGFHADYHKTGDHPEKLAYDNMVKIAQTGVHILLAIGNGEKSPRYKGFRPADPGPAVQRRKLGVAPPAEKPTADDYEKLGIAATEGAMKVDEVTAGSVADKAGIKAGDYLLSVGGQKLGRGRESADMRTALEKVQAGKEVPIELWREGEKKTVKAVWDK